VTLVVEDGTGLVNANALCTVASVTDFHALRGGNAIWTGATVPEQTAGVVLATDYLCDEGQFKYRGTRLGGRLPWGRTGVSYRRGAVLPDAIVPALLADAAAILAPRAIVAMREGASLKPPVGRDGQIASESLSGVASVTYINGAPLYTVHQDVHAMLSSLLRDQRDELEDAEFRVVVQRDDPVNDAALRAGTFSDGSALGFLGGDLSETIPAG
jgi:hypothetical protein